MFSLLRRQMLIMVSVFVSLWHLAVGLPITVETAPHYLAFNAEDVQDGNTLLKCAPPIRDKANQLGLFQGLKVHHKL